MMLTRGNQVLLALTIALLLFVVADRIRKSPSAPEKVTWPPVEADIVDRFVLTNPEGHVEARKEDNRWTLVVPYTEPMDEDLFEGILRTFKDPLSPDVKAADRVDDLARYGLDDEHRVQVEFFAEDIPLLQLELGRSLPGSTSFVRQLGDEAVYRARVSARYRLDKPPDSFRNHAIVDLHAGHIVGMTLVRGEERHRYKRLTAHWVCLEHPELQLDARLVESMARSIAGLRAKRLVDDPPPDLFDEVGLRIVFEGDEGELGEVDFGPPTEDGHERYARIGDRVFTVSASRYSTFDQRPHGLRDRDVVKLESEEVERVTVALGPRRFTAEPTGEYTWKLLEPRGYSIDTQQMAYSLNAALKIRAHGLADDLDRAASGVDDPGALVVTIERIEAAPIVVRVGPQREDRLHAMFRDGLDQGYLLRTTQVRSLTKGFGLEAP